MKKCPKCGCKEFYVTAHITQDWLVDTNGDHLRTEEKCVEVTHFPKDDDLWQCADCGNAAEGKEFEYNEVVQEMKKYTIDQYQEFCNDALVLPPLDDFYDGNINEVEWYKTHKIHIMVDGHDMELDYYADNVTEIYRALEEMYEIEMEVKGIDKEENKPIIGNTVSDEYRPAELKDIIRIAVQSDWDNFGYKLDSFAEFIQDFIKKEWNLEKVMWYYNLIHKDIKTYNNLCRCNFNKVDMSKICDVNSQLVKKAIDELICTDRELLHGMTEDDKDSDITFVMDYTLKLSGEMIGWFYGEPDEEYFDDLVDDYKRKLFGEEN